MQSFYLLGLITLFSTWVVRKILSFREQLRGINYLPGYRDVFAPLSAVTIFLPRIPYITPGRNRIFDDKYSCFAKFGSDVISQAYAFPMLRAELFTADAEVIKEVTSSRFRFPKPLELYQGLSIYGNNVIASEGEEWKHTKRIVAPAFSERNNKLVWDASVRVIEGLYHEVWNDRDTISTNNFAETTLQIALFVLAMAAFGQNVSWQDSDAPPPKHKMSFKRALHLMSVDIVFKLAFSERILGLTKRTRGVRDAFHELRAYMLEMIAERKHTDVARHDVLSSLIEANNEEGSAGLTDSGLMGNFYIFLLAGHETTAHLLGFAFALLAIHQDEQENLYQQIKSVIPESQMPTYDDVPKLTYTMAVFNETLRMFPLAVSIPKYSQEDTFFTTKNGKGENITVTVPKGTYISINVPGLHYNPRYWKDPHKFDPSRFLGDWPRDAFLPFSSGPRACIGRRFSEVEGLAVVSYTILRYKVTVTEEPQFSGETFEQRKERVLRTENKITLGPRRLPLTFTRRL